MPELLLATTNQGKAREYYHLLKGISFELVTLSEKGIGAGVNEKDSSFEENAQLKAVSYAELSNLITLAEDSGLEVDALGGEPGVRSARFAGENASDKDRVDYLLARLKGVPQGKRSARFRCVIAIAIPGGKMQLCHGECHGLIGLEVRGNNGFGYDPIFYLPEFDKTMAELTLEVKNQVSHRAKAAQKAYPILECLAREAKS